MQIDCSKHSHFDNHEEVHRFVDSESGLLAYIAIHRPGPLGVAGGGCRMWHYRDEQAALRDVLRLSRDMTHKLALSGLRAGGAKCVIVGDAGRDKSEALIKALGQAIHSLQGRFVAGGDVGTNGNDLNLLAQTTPYVEQGSYGRDTVSEATAGGVYWALRAALEHSSPQVKLKETSIAIQGVGKVGGQLARLLAAEGANLLVSDVDVDRAARLAEELGARCVASDDILRSEVDVLAPCALGDVLNASTVEELRCRLVVGSANNQLAEEAIAQRLNERGILYVPDFVANMGGTLAGAQPHACRDAQSLRQLVRQVETTTRQILVSAAAQGTTPQAAAVQLAHQQLIQQAAGGSAMTACFKWLWKKPPFARAALRLRNLVEETRGRWRSAPDALALGSRP